MARKISCTKLNTRGGGFFFDFDFGSLKLPRNSCVAQSRPGKMLLHDTTRDKLERHIKYAQDVWE